MKYPSQNKTFTFIDSQTNPSYKTPLEVSGQNNHYRQDRPTCCSVITEQKK
jgi:hypothetical protein